MTQAELQFDECFIALCRIIRTTGLTDDTGPVWKSLRNNDGSPAQKGYFFLGIGTAQGKQILYQMPEGRWDDCYFAKELSMAPAHDGHTPDDLLRRLKDLP